MRVVLKVMPAFLKVMNPKTQLKVANVFVNNLKVTNEIIGVSLVRSPVTLNRIKLI